VKKTEENKSLISIPLDIPDVRVLKTEVTATGDFRITVESTLGSARCRTCGRETTEFHCLDRLITLRHLPILDRRVLFAYGLSVSGVHTVMTNRLPPSGFLGMRWDQAKPKPSSNTFCCAL
jgi:hypothetical protein